MANNILIVDDSAVVRMANKRIIEKAGVDIGEIFQAENGQVALQLLKEQKIDLVLIDLHMPQMGGVEVVNRMKASEETSSIPIVIVSAESSSTRVKELQDVGIDGYLRKPFTAEEFRQTILNVWGAIVK